MKKLLFITCIIGLLASCTNTDEIPKDHIGEFRLEKTQKIFFDGYTKGEYGDVYYDQDCDEVVIFFITSDSIGISPESTCGTVDYSLYRWAYDKIKVSEIEDSYIKDKYEQVNDLDYVIRYYSDSIMVDAGWEGYFGVYKTSDYDISMIKYDIGIFHMLEY